MLALKVEKQFTVKEDAKEEANTLWQQRLSDFVLKVEKQFTVQEDRKEEVSIMLRGDQDKTYLILY